MNKKGVIETVPLDIPTAFFLGGVIALTDWWSVKKRESILFSRASLAGALCGLWYGFAVTYFYVRYPDWMLAYAVDYREIPTVLMLFIFYVSLAIAGFSSSVLTQVAIKEGHKVMAWIPAFTGLVVLIYVWGITWDQYFHIGTYVEYHSGNAVPLQRHSSMQKAMNILGPVGLLPYVVVGVVNLRRGLKQRSHEGKPASHG